MIVAYSIPGLKFKLEVIIVNYLEKRLDPRLDIEEELRYKIIGDEYGSSSAVPEKAKARNISKGGVCISLPHKIEVGNVIRVEIPIENEDRLIKAFCEVQWCSMKAQSDYELGLSFIALKEEDVEFLDNYVKNKSERVM
ncbi:MAG TPA: PilZ domain-containing protein [bacterium]|nr:PilZ domain-containing protein [bacterium]